MEILDRHNNTYNSSLKTLQTAQEKNFVSCGFDSRVNLISFHLKATTMRRYKSKPRSYYRDATRSRETLRYSLSRNYQSIYLQYSRMKSDKNYVSLRGIMLSDIVIRMRFFP